MGNREPSKAVKQIGGLGRVMFYEDNCGSMEDGLKEMATQITNLYCPLVLTLPTGSRTCYLIPRFEEQQVLTTYSNVSILHGQHLQYPNPDLQNNIVFFISKLGRK